MDISPELLTIAIIIFSSNLLLLLKYRAKHINEAGWKIFIFNLENQSCNPYWSARHVTAWVWPTISKIVHNLFSDLFLENFVHPQAVTCLTHQYKLQDWFSRLEMKIFHPVSFMCSFLEICRYILALC